MKTKKKKQKKERKKTAKSSSNTNIVAICCCWLTGRQPDWQEVRQPHNLIQGVFSKSFMRDKLHLRYLQENKHMGECVQSSFFLVFVGMRMKTTSMEMIVFLQKFENFFTENQEVFQTRFFPITLWGKKEYSI